MSYCTVSDVKSNGWTAPSGITDAALSEFITLAEDLINKFTNDNFNELDMELYTDGSGSKSLWINKFTPYRCLEVTNIEDVDTGEVYDSSYYEVYERIWKLL